jgi:hypothetical protein
MANQKGRWVRVKSLTREEKAAIAVIFDRFIADVLKPLFLPKIRPTEFNYPVDIFGKWRGGKYSFITRYRSGFADNPGEEFDAPFTRLDYVEERLDETLFDVMWRPTPGNGGHCIVRSSSTKP